MSNPTSTSLEVFFDLSARQVVKIYLDTVHLNGQLYIRLRNIIEDGGGRITPNKEAASIWIVDPEAPYALGDPPENISILYAPWLIACARKGSFLGPEHENWCGFKVASREKPTDNAVATLTYPQSNSRIFAQPTSYPINSPAPFPPAPSVKPKERADLNIGHWAGAVIANVFKYPTKSFPPAWGVDISQAPSPPPIHTLLPPYSNGKRLYNSAEQYWMVDIIQWCLSEYPDITMNAICEVLSMKGPHRTSEAYSSRIKRHLQWFADRSPLLAERLYNYQEENKIEPSYDLVEPSDSDTPPRCVFNAAERARLEDEPKVTKFTREDWDSFIRFAAARPSGMEPTGLEKAADVWELLAKTYPNHSSKSWRTWHQHRQQDLKEMIQEYRRVNMGL